MSTQQGTAPLSAFSATGGGGDFSPLHGFASANCDVRLVRLTGFGVGAEREFPEYSGKDA